MEGIGGVLDGREPAPLGRAASAAAGGAEVKCVGTVAGGSMAGGAATAARCRAARTGEPVVSGSALYVDPKVDGPLL
jgi:hypothetical protein